MLRAKDLLEALPIEVRSLWLAGDTSFSACVYAPDKRRCYLTASEAALPIAEVAALVIERCHIGKKE